MAGNHRRHSYRAEPVDVAGTHLDRVCDLLPCSGSVAFGRIEMLSPLNSSDDAVLVATRDAEPAAEQLATQVLLAAARPATISLTSCHDAVDVSDQLWSIW